MDFPQSTHVKHSEKQTGRLAGVLLALLLPLGLGLFLNGERGLWATDEGRYAAGAVQMLESNQFTDIYLNHEVLHFTKPPLTYWAIAGSIKLFGQNEFAARMPSALGYWLTAVLLLFLGSHYVGKAPWLPAVLYATFFFPFLGSNVVSTDTILTLFVTLSGAGFLRFIDSGKERFLVLMWSGLALAFMTKGPAGLIPLAGFAGWLIYRRDWRRLRKVATSWGVPAFAVIGLTWYAWACLRHPGLLDYFLRDEVFARIATGQHHRHPEWYGPIEVYLPVILIGGLPWHGIWLWLRWRRPDRLHFATNDTDRLLLSWAGTALAIFTLSKSRLPSYLLQIFAPMAIWFARRLQSCFATSGSIRTPVFLSAWVLLLASIKLVGASLTTERDIRALADQINGRINQEISEIIYVDERPEWGLSFYLGVDVEENWMTAPPERPTYNRVESLEKELSEKHPGAPVLFIVNNEIARRFSHELVTRHRSFRSLGRLDKGTAYLVWDDDRGPSGPC